MDTHKPYQFLMHKLVVLLVVAFSILVSVYGKNLYFSTNYKVYFSDKNPNLTEFEAFQKKYTKNDFLSIVVHNPNGDLFNHQSFTAMQYLTDQSWLLPYSIRVDSLTNYQHTYAYEDELIVEHLIGEPPESYTPNKQNELKNIALNEEALVHRLINKTGDTTQIMVIHQFTDDDPNSIVKTAQAAQKLAANFEEKFPNYEIGLSGTVMLNHAFIDATQRDMQTLIPLMYILIFVMLIVFFRSLWATFSTLLVVAFSATAGMGFGGFMGYPLTPPSSGAITVILTLAVADSVHLIVGYLQELKKGSAKKDAILASLKSNFKAITLTSLTTALGFLSLNFSDAPPFHHLGNMSAFGIMMAWILSVTFLPWFVTLVDIKPRIKSQAKTDKKTPMLALAKWVNRFNKQLFAVFTITIAVLTSFIPQIELNDEFVRYFDKTMQFRQDTDLMMEKLSGIYQAEFSVPSQGKGGIHQPEYLNNLEKFVNWLETQDEVVHVLDHTQVIRNINQSMHADDPAYDVLPQDNEMNAQYLLVYEMSLPFGLDLNNRINMARSETRVTVTLKELPSSAIQNFKRKSEQWMKDNLPSYMQSIATSPAIMFSYISERNIEAMIKGNAFALISICLLIALFLKSFKIGLFSMVPNILPALAAFGIWAITYEQVNLTVAIITTLTLGIIVDDTIHLLSKYEHGRKDMGLSPKEAVEYALTKVGKALIVTTISLIIGFSVLILSPFQANSVLGLMTVLTIGLALTIDFFLLLPMLTLFDKRNLDKKQD